MEAEEVHPAVVGFHKEVFVRRMGMPALSTFN